MLKNVVSGIRLDLISAILSLIEWKFTKYKFFVVVQSLSWVWLFVTHGLQHTWLPVLQGTLPEFAQIHVHWVSDAIQPSHPLLPHFPPALNLSQHQVLLRWVSSSHQVAQSIGVSASASVLPTSIQDWFPLGLTGLISLQSKGLSRVFNTTVQRHQFFSTRPSL